MSKIITRKSNLKKTKEIDLLPTGSTLLNLNCADNPFGGFGLGRMVNLIGDSSSGKTLITLTMFAEMSLQKRWKDYDLYFDDAEAALGFDLKHLFGKRMAERVDTDTFQSNTIQRVYGNIQSLLKEGSPFVYVIDSWDALTSEEEMQRAERYMKDKKDRKKNEEGGSYGVDKAKLTSQLLRVITGDLKNTESVLIIISQTRDNLGWGFSTKSRSGGRALKFFASHEGWLSIIRSIKKRERAVGVECQFELTKNKLTGKQFRRCPLHIFYEYGVDNIGTNVDFLIENNFWKAVKEKEREKKRGVKKNKASKILIPEWKFEGSRVKLIDYIEEQELEQELIDMVTEKYWAIEETMSINRKRKYE